MGSNDTNGINADHTSESQNHDICVRDRKIASQKKRFGYLLGHLSFWVSGMESSLIFYTKNKKKKINT